MKDAFANVADLSVLLYLLMLLHGPQVDMEFNHVSKPQPHHNSLSY